MAHKFRTHIDLNQNQMLNAVLQKVANASLASAIPSPTAGQVYYDTTNNKAYFHNGSTWIDMSGGVSYTTFTDGTTAATPSQSGDTFKFRSANNAITVATQNNDATHGDNLNITFNVGNVDHNSLANLTTGDPHSQYVHISTARTISAAHTFSNVINFTNGGTPFSVFGTGVVTNLNADMVDGFHASTTSGANYIPVANGSGKIAAGWIQEVIALADLSDVSAKTGTGSTVVMDNQPTLTKPTLVASSSISLDAGSGRLQNIADPVNAQDAATKNYVDVAVQGLDIHPSVRVATTANVNLSGGAPSTVDGQSLAVNDRILVKNQTTGSQNGIYVVQTVGTGANGTWVRSSDADTSAEVTSGMFVFVSAGTVNAATGWVLTTPDPLTLGTTSLAFSQFSGSGAYSAANVGTSGVGTWDSTSGNLFNFRKINNASNKLSVTLNGQQIDIDVSEANLTLNNIGGTLGTTKGGTGATTAVGARQNLGTPGMYSAYVNSGVTTQTFTHGLNTTDVIAQVYEVATGQEIDVDIVRASANTVTVSFNGATASGTELRVVIFGQG